MEPHSQKPRNLLDDSSFSDSEGESGGVPINNELGEFRVNEEYARRFEHNKKREELQQLEAKLGKKPNLGNRHGSSDSENSREFDESSSDDEEEDETGELVTEALDFEIATTLNAIRSRDPRVYDEKTTFYSIPEEEEDGILMKSKKKENPMFLRDYHRKNLLSGTSLLEDNSTDPPKTYAQQQTELKDAVLKEMRDAAGNHNDEKQVDGGDEFLVPKRISGTTAPKEERKLDVENADKDPEAFLSKFLSSRAWVPEDKPEMHPFESDDDDENERAEAFEEAYNFRFEDPNKANEKIITHARDSTNKFSVRREEKSSRRKLREAEQLAREEREKQREAEKKRLRKLKVEELQSKVEQIKEVAGLRASKLTDEDWAHFLDDAWDAERWEKEMQKRFGDEYYTKEEDDESENSKSRKTRHLKKPTWDDDIDIKDIVPDFEDEGNPVSGQIDTEMNSDNFTNNASAKGKKSKAQEKREQKRESRKERLRIEEAADRNLDLDITLLPGATKKNTDRFRYRETSPESFGLTTLDILMADDSHLNQYAGLKKLAPFRDSEKKRRDQRKLGKKARLRQWRKETFGSEHGPKLILGGEGATQAKEDLIGEEGVDIQEGEPRKKKRKRSKAS